MSSIFYPDSITITDRTLQMCYKKASPTKKFKFCLYENAEVYFAQFPMEQKSGESPLMVARLSLLFLYPNDTNGEVGFAQFPMVQKRDGNVFRLFLFMITGKALHMYLPPNCIASYIRRETPAYPFPDN